MSEHVEILGMQCFAMDGVPRDTALIFSSRPGREPETSRLPFVLKIDPSDLQSLAALDESQRRLEAMKRAACALGLKWEMKSDPGGKLQFVVSRQ